MKSVIAFACLLAVASAGYIHAPAVAYGAYGAYEDGSYRGEGLYESVYKGEGLVESQDLGRVAVAAPIAYAARTYGGPVAYAAHTYAAPAIGLASEARQVDPVAIAAGAPLPTGDTYEVAAAKAAHFAAHAAAKGNVYTTPFVGAHTYGAHTYGAHTYAAHTYGAPIFHAGLTSEARQVDPVAIAAGAPLPTGDTYEVAAAKAAHFRAHAAAKGHIIAKRSPVYLGAYSPIAHTYGYSTYAAPLAYSGYGYGRYF